MFRITKDKSMMNNLKRILKLAKDAWLILGITFLSILLLEGVFYITFLIRDNTRTTFSDYRIKADTYSDSSWVQKYWEEFSKSSSSDRVQWMPYVYWRRKPFQGDYINIDSNGIRQTWKPNINHKEMGDPFTIFIFGGSTMWGTGARDNFTIPSILAKKLQEKGIYTETINFGESGYVSSQEVIALILELKKGNIPDLAIFYDGVNDTYSAYQNHVAGLTHNEYNRMNEFNVSKSMGYKKMISILIRENRMGSTVRFINGLIHRLNLLRKPRVAVNYQANNDNLAYDNEPLINDMIDVYNSNIEVVNALADYYNFKYLFYWQPTIFQKKHLTEYEELHGQKSSSFHLFLKKTYDYLAQQSDFTEEGDLPFHNLSLVFSNVQKPLFVDYCHLGELGNEMIAEKMAMDVFAIYTKKTF